MKAVETLANAGVPVGVLVASIVLALKERDVEAIIEQAGAAVANSIGYTCVRLPYELKQLFRERLELHYPDRAVHIRKRVQVATRKAGLDRAWDTVLDTTQFMPTRVHSPKGELS